MYFAPELTGGAHGPLEKFGKTDGITMTMSVDFKEHYNTEGCTPLLDARLPSQVTATVSFQTAEITIDMLNKAFGGNLIDSSQTAVTSQAVVIAGSEVGIGKYAFTGYYNATAVVVKDSTDTTTYVDGTDYTYDGKSGYLAILSGGAITDGAELHLTIDAPAITMSTSATMKNADLIGRFEVVTSSQTGNNYKYIFKKLSVTLDGDFAIKSKDDIATLAFTGSALVDSTVTGSLSDYLDIIELDSTAC